MLNYVFYLVCVKSIRLQYIYTVYICIYIYIYIFFFLQGENYIPVQQTHKINARPNHECTSKKIVTLTCVDEFGEIRRFTDS